MLDAVNGKVIWYNNIIKGIILIIWIEILAILCIYAATSSISGIIIEKFKPMDNRKDIERIKNIQD